MQPSIQTSGFSSCFERMYLLPLLKGPFFFFDFSYSLDIIYLVFLLRKYSYQENFFFSGSVLLSETVLEL